MDFAEFTAYYDPNADKFRRSQIKKYKRSGCRVESITSEEADALRPSMHAMAERCGFGKVTILTYFTLIHYLLIRPSAIDEGMKLLAEIRQDS